jgi:FK506-binding protein 4/5
MWEGLIYMLMEKLVELSKGCGLYKPDERADVVINIEVKVEGEVVLTGSTHQIHLGEPESEVWYCIEKCVMRMKLHEESEFGGKLPDGKVIWCKIHLVSFQRAPDLWDLSVDDKLTLSQRYKCKGNEHFKDGGYPLAAVMYSRALKYIISISDGEENVEVISIKMACLNNMAVCQLKLSQFENCVMNCTKILAKEPTNSKALYRRGTAYMKMNDLELAKIDLLKAQDIEPHSQAIATQLKDLSTITKTTNNQYRKAMEKMFGGKPTS